MKSHLSLSRLLLALVGLATLASLCQGQTLYNFGNPTAEEQLYVELINRARANPPAEGARLAATTDPDVTSAYSYFSVNLAMMQTEFNAIPALPPLAPNASLTTAARGHSAWMLANAVQSHNETNPNNDPFIRMTNAGYTYSTAGENVYAYVKSVWHGHAGFEVDWGTGGTGGMQNPRGHRSSIHNANFREIGVGVVNGTNNTVNPPIGPQLVTQDFGARNSSPNLGTGVAYYDLNSNNFYDLGEGISGLTVNVSGASNYCTTAAGGGWVVPCPTTAETRTVTFSGLNVNQTTSIVFPASQNAKADLMLSYSPPAITSPSTAVAGNNHNVTFNPVGGATSYSWARSTMSTAAAENCESTTNVTTSTTGSYQVSSTTVKQQGTASFHLLNSTGASQSIQLNALYYGGASPSLSFQSRIRYAQTTEQFRVQVKEEGSTIWQNVYSQAGTGGSGETAFALRSAALPGMAGKSFRVRFLLDFPSGSYFTDTSDIVGWFIDAITFSGVSTLSGTVTQSLSGTSGSFTPNSGDYLLSVSPVISGRDFPASYQVLNATTGVVSPPQIAGQPSSVTVNSGATATFTVTANGTSPSYQWYVGNSGVTTNPISGATGNSYTTPALASTTSYWVRVTNSAATVDSNTATATVITPPVITPPVITSQPVAASIVSGSSTTFNVATTGTSPTYQWYAGNSGVTTNPISGANSNSFATPPLSSTASYWVRVSNAAGNADSNTATATVVMPPAITGHPGSVTVPSGSGTTLSVTATGANLAYQWYQGASGSIQNPISGAISSSYITPNLSSTTSYWAKVSNIAGSADSNTATVTVAYPPTILSQPVSPTISKNTSTTLSVTASGPSLTYQWYQGNSPSTTTLIAGATSSSYTTPTLANPKSYWARVTNSAGFANTVTATVTTTNGAVTRNFGVWASEIETANSLTAGSIANANGDFDKDGRNNLVEYAFGASPIIGNDTAPRLPVVLPSATHLILRYQRDTAVTDITITPETAAGLNNWKSPGQAGAPAGFTDTLTSTASGIETREATVPRSSGAAGFMRMRVTQP
ncbi:MAG: CAP domain-containing protein [Verrucomicrobiota bacterium]